MCSATRRRSVAALLAAPLLCLTVLVVVASPAQAEPGPTSCRDCTDRTTVQPGPGAQSFVGSQVIATDGRGGAQRVSPAASGDCPDCTWKVQPVCELRPGVILPVACDEVRRAGGCVAAGRSGGVLHAVFVSRSRGPYELTGTVCLGEGVRPVALADIEAQVRAYLDELVPAAPTLTMRPVGGTTLIHLPTLFLATGATTAAGRLFPAGIPVQVAATATGWTWQVDGGASVFRTDFPGRRYDPAHDPRVDPGHYATHTFTTTGTHQLTCTVSWTATASITGLGDLPVPGAVQRTSAALAVQVREARAELIANP